MKLWKSLNLPQQFARIAGPFLRERRPDRPGHAVGPHRDDVADFAVLDALVQFLQCPAVTGHQAHAHLEVLGHRLLAELEHPAGSRAVGRQRLLHEDVQALLDGVGKMHPAERQRRGEDRNVARLQAIHRLLVAVETDELALLGHVHLVGELLLAGC